jgi:hypothetical protein
VRQKSIGSICCAADGEKKKRMKMSGDRLRWSRDMSRNPRFGANQFPGGNLTH